MDCANELPRLLGGTYLRCALVESVLLRLQTVRYSSAYHVPPGGPNQLTGMKSWRPVQPLASFVNS
mgnify:CR=1 FL=1